MAGYEYILSKIGSDWVLLAILALSYWYAARNSHILLVRLRTHSKVSRVRYAMYRFSHTYSFIVSCLYSEGAGH